MSLPNWEKNLKEGEENCIEIAKGLGIWPKTTGIKKEKRKGESFPKISLKYWVVEWCNVGWKKGQLKDRK